MLIDVINEFTRSDWIELFGIFASIILSIVAILIALLTLRQNSKMLEESTRPYICISFDSIRISSYLPRFTIKNYGQTGATIIEFLYPNNIDFGKEIFNEQFAHVVGLFLAPQQSVSIELLKIPDEITNVEFSIKYKTVKKKYTEKFDLYIGKSPYHYAVSPSVDDKNAQRMAATALIEICKHISL